MPRYLQFNVAIWENLLFPVVNMTDPPEDEQSWQTVGTRAVLYPGSLVKTIVPIGAVLTASEGISISVSAVDVNEQISAARASMVYTKDDGVHTRVSSDWKPLQKCHYTYIDLMFDVPVDLSNTPGSQTPMFHIFVELNVYDPVARHC